MVKVLVTDDSVVYRSQIKAALANIPGLEVVGIASNGKIALERMQQLKVDLLILDLEMPEMDGIQTLKEISRLGLHCKVLVFSSVSKRGAEITLEALRLGASDFIPKPGNHSVDTVISIEKNPSIMIQEALEPKIMALFPNLGNTVAPVSAGVKTYNNVNLDLFEPLAVVIGSSTGGPTVLENIFSQLGPPLRCPIFVAQHMPPVFTASLAERIQKISGIPTSEAKHGAAVVPNAIYIAPGNFHMSLSGTRDKASIVLDQGPLVNSVRPAVDNLFNTAAEIYRARCLGIVLTGMGADGKNGAQKIKENNGAVLIQEQNSCVVFGMPGAVMAEGAFDKALNPAELVDFLKLKVATQSSLKEKKVVGG